MKSDFSSLQHSPIVTECVANKIFKNSNFVRVVTAGSSTAITVAFTDLFSVNNYDQIPINQSQASLTRQVSTIERLVEGDDTIFDNAK